MSADELHQAQLEIRFLKETISALRDELEKNNISRDEDIQKAVAAAHDDNRQLREAVNSLRLTLEKRRSTTTKRCKAWWLPIMTSCCNRETWWMRCAMSWRNKRSVMRMKLRTSNASIGMKCSNCTR